jgi:hypothetical protein
LLEKKAFKQDLEPVSAPGIRHNRAIPFYALAIREKVSSRFMKKLCQAYQVAIMGIGFFDSAYKVNSPVDIGRPERSSLNWR